MKKKIAVCFSGQLRCHHKLTKLWIDRFFNSFNSDEFEIFIFFHTNNQYKETIKTISEDYSNYKLLLYVENDLDFTDLIPCIFEKPTGGLWRGGHNQLLKEFHSMDRVIQLKHKFEDINNISFDYVFRMRYDVVPLNRFDIKYLKGDKFYISDHDHHGGLNSRFTMSNSINMNKIYTVIENIPKLCDQIDIFSGEPYWKMHLNHIGIEVDFIDFKVGLVRDYDENLPTHEHGIISINGEEVYKFNNIEDKLDISDLYLT